MKQIQQAPENNLRVRIPSGPLILQQIKIFKAEN